MVNDNSSIIKNLKDAPFQKIWHEFCQSVHETKSSLIIFYGRYLLTKHSRHLKHEAELFVAEKVLIAALESNYNIIAKECSDIIHKKCINLNGNRIKFIEKLSMEAKDHNNALKDYKKILSDDPNDIITRKRLIAVYLYQGKIIEAIQYLNSYLEEFMTDAEAWHELGEIYISQCSLDRAAFCFEELLLHDPHCLFYVINYAEILFYLNNFDTCRKYYCYALTLDDTNVRALWGLVLLNIDCLASLKNYSQPQTCRNRSLPDSNNVKLCNESSSMDLLITLTKNSLDRLYSIYSNRIASHSNDEGKNGAEVFNDCILNRIISYKNSLDK